MGMGNLGLREVLSESCALNVAKNAIHFKPLENQNENVLALEISNCISGS